MKMYVFWHKPKWEIGYHKMWSIGQKNLNIPTVTQYCFSIFGQTVMFVRKGVL